MHYTVGIDESCLRNAAFNGCSVVRELHTDLIRQAVRNEKSGPLRLLPVGIESLGDMLRDLANNPGYSPVDPGTSDLLVALVKLKEKGVLDLGVVHVSHIEGEFLDYDLPREGVQNGDDARAAYMQQLDDRTEFDLPGNSEQVSDLFFHFATLYGQLFYYNPHLFKRPHKKNLKKSKRSKHFHIQWLVKLLTKCICDPDRLACPITLELMGSVEKKEPPDVPYVEGKFNEFKEQLRTDLKTSLMEHSVSTSMIRTSGFERITLIHHPKDELPHQQRVLHGRNHVPSEVFGLDVSHMMECDDEYRQEGRDPALARWLQRERSNQGTSIARQIDIFEDDSATIRFDIDILALFD